MFLISPTIAILILLFLIGLAIVISYRTKSFEKYEKTRYHTFFSILAGLGIFLTFIFYYNIVYIQQQQQENVSVQEITKINDIINKEILTEIEKVTDIIPKYIASITPLINNDPGIDDPNSILANTTRVLLSQRIFSLWQYVIESKTLLLYDEVGYISYFLQFANSKLLYKDWNTININYNQNVKTFGNLLFEYALPIKDQINTAYSNAALELIKNKDYQKLITVDNSFFWIF